MNTEYTNMYLTNNVLSPEMIRMAEEASATQVKSTLEEVAYERGHNPEESEVSTMKVVTFLEGGFDLSKFNHVGEGTNGWNKPSSGGLWACPVTSEYNTWEDFMQYDWQQWYGDMNEVVLTIDTSKMDFLRNHIVEGKDSWGDKRKQPKDFSQIAYTGITALQYDQDEDGDHDGGMYGWDVDTVFIMDPSIILHVEDKGITHPVPLDWRIENHQEQISRLAKRMADTKEYLDEQSEHLSEGLDYDEKGVSDARARLRGDRKKKLELSVRLNGLKTLADPNESKNVKAMVRDILIEEGLRYPFLFESEEEVSTISFKAEIEQDEIATKAKQIEEHPNAPLVDCNNKSLRVHTQDGGLWSIPDDFNLMSIDEDSFMQMLYEARRNNLEAIERYVSLYHCFSLEETMKATTTAPTTGATATNVEPVLPAEPISAWGPAPRTNPTIVNYKRDDESTHLFVEEGEEHTIQSTTLADDEVLQDVGFDEGCDTPKDSEYYESNYQSIELPTAAAVGIFTNAGSSAMVTGTMAAVERACTMLEHGADNTGSKDNFTDYELSVLGQIGKVLKATVTAPDTINLYHIRKMVEDNDLLRDSKGFGPASKTRFFQLSKKQQATVRLALEKCKKTITETQLTRTLAALTKSLTKHHFVASYKIANRARKIFFDKTSRLFGDNPAQRKAKAASILSQGSKAKDLYDHIITLCKESDENFGQLHGMSHAAKYKYIQDNNQQFIVEEFRKLMVSDSLEDMELLSDLAIVYLADRVLNFDQSDFWLKICAASYRLLTRNCTTAEEAVLAEFPNMKPANVVKHAKRVYEIARNGGKFTSSNGKMVDATNLLFKTMDYLGYVLDTIQGSVKEFDDGKEIWTRLPHLRVGEVKIGEAWVDTVAHVLEGQAMDRTMFKRNMVSPSATLKGTGVAKNPAVTYMNKYGFTDASYSVGASFCAEWGGKSDKVMVEVIKECPNKTKKRLKALTSDYEYSFDTSDMDFVVEELQSRGWSVEATSGRVVVHAESCGLKPGVYNNFRMWTKKGLLKAALEVVDHGNWKKDTVYSSPDNYKGNELEVHAASNTALVGHKTDTLTANTSCVWLPQPDIVEAAAEAQYKHALKAIQSLEEIDARMEGKLGFSTVMGSYRKLAAEVVGDAENIHKCKFTLSRDFSVRKIYFRAVHVNDGVAMDKWSVLPNGVIVMPESDFEKMCIICGGADSDDSFYMETFSGFVQVRRDPNIGYEIFMKELSNVEINSILKAIAEGVI